MNDLTWFGWLYLSLVALNVVAGIVMIGHERKPRTPADAVVTLLTAAFFIWGIFVVGVTS